MSKVAPDTLPADFFSKPKSAAAPDTLPADFFSKAAAPVDKTAVLQSVKDASTVKPLVPRTGDDWMSAAKDFTSSVVDGLNPLPLLKSLYEHPLDTLHGIPDAQKAQYEKAKESYSAGNYTEAAGHTIAAMIPLIGPAAAQAGETIGSGKVASGLGLSTALLAPSAADFLRSKVTGAKIAPPLITTNPAEASAVRFGLKNDLPVDAATATGNPAVRGTQWLADRSIGGSIANSGRDATAATALSGKLQRLADQSAPVTTPAQAGEAVQKALDAKITTHSMQADTAYSNLRAIEANPANLKSIQTGTQPAPLNLQTLGQGPRGTIPVMEKIPLPVDLRAAKAALAPILENLKKQMPTAQQLASKGLKAIDNIVSGPDYAPASQVDAGLGAIKGIVREADAPNLRNISQGLAAKAVNELGAAVDAAVKQGGQPAVDALKAGRDATKAKYAVADVLDGVRDEPVQAFNQLITSKDARIDQLKAIAQHAPAEMPKVGSAFLNDMLDTATSQGGFDRAQGLWAKWDKLGPQTKSVLFKDPAYIKDLDDFFMLSKKLAENPNPSGTGYMASLGAQGAVMVSNPIMGALGQVGGYTLSKMMHNPTVVRALVDGLRLSSGATKTAAGSLAVTKALNLIKNAAAESSPSPQSGPAVLAPAQ